MIPITTILTEVSAAVNAVSGVTFKSHEEGFIREVVPVTQMPSCDIAAGDHTTAEFAGYTDYTLPLIIVMRRQDVGRKTNADTFNDFIERVCAALTTHSPVAFDHIGAIASQRGEEPGGDGSMVRVAVITCNALYHD